MLIHSPLLGPTSWAPVARELERRGRTAAVPALLGVAAAEAPPWGAMQDAVRAAAEPIATPLVLVGHSGGGVLLPMLADALSADVAGLVFVDAFLPPPIGSTRLAPAQLIEELRALAADGVLPPWSSWLGEQWMRELVPDDRLRTVLEEEMPALPLSYFEADVPLPSGWHARPCGYVLLSDQPHAQSAADARGRGWPVAEVPGAGHLAIATDPVALADALLGLERTLARSI